MANYADEAENTYKSMSSFATDALGNIEDEFVSFFETGKFGFKELADFAIRELSRIATQRMFTAPLSNMLGGLFGGTGMAELAGNTAGLFGGDQIGAMLNFLPSAKGNVFNSSDLSRYSNQIHDTPKIFRFATGAGVFAEAGPEAIMPLKRGPDGRLGVQAHTRDSNKSADSRPIQVFMTINTPDADSFRRSQNQIERQMGSAARRALARS